MARRARGVGRGHGCVPIGSLSRQRRSSPASRSPSARAAATTARSPPTTTASRGREYVAQVDAICKKTSAAVQAELRQAAGARRRERDVQEPADQGRADPAQASTTCRTTKFQRFKAIEPPTADRAQVAEITNGRAGDADGVRGVPARRRQRRSREVHRRRDRRDRLARARRAAGHELRLPQGLLQPAGRPRQHPVARGGGRRAGPCPPRRARYIVARRDVRRAPTARTRERDLRWPTPCPTCRTRMTRWSRTSPPRRCAFTTTSTTRRTSTRPTPRSRTRAGRRRWRPRSS